MCPKGRIFHDPTHPTLQHEDQHTKTMSLWTWFLCSSSMWPSPPSNMFLVPIPTQKAHPMDMLFMFGAFLGHPPTHSPSKHEKHILIGVFFMFGASLVLPTSPPP